MQGPMNLQEQLWSKNARAARSSYSPDTPITRLRSELSECKPWDESWPKPFENLLDLLPITDRAAIYTCSPDPRAAARQPLTHRMPRPRTREEGMSGSDHIRAEPKTLRLILRASFSMFFTSRQAGPTASCVVRPRGEFMSRCWSSFFSWQVLL